MCGGMHNVWGKDNLPLQRASGLDNLGFCWKKERRETRGGWKTHQAMGSPKPLLGGCSDTGVGVEGVRGLVALNSSFFPSLG